MNVTCTVALTLSVLSLQHDSVVQQMSLCLIGRTDTAADTDLVAASNCHGSHTSLQYGNHSNLSVLFRGY